MRDSTDSGTTASTDKASRRRRPRWARAIVIALVVLILAVFFAGPPIAKNILEKQLTKNLSTAQAARTASIERVRINPLALSCAIEGLSITDGDRKPLVRWRSFYASLDLRTLVTHEWRFRTIALDGFSARIAVLKDGRLNFADLMPPPAPDTAAQSATVPPAPDKPQKKPSPLHINELIVTDAHIDYSDASLPRPFATQLGPMSFTARDFQTGGPERAPGEFSATTESGETFSWRGNLAVTPLLSHGEIRIGNLSIKKYAPYYDSLVRFDVLDGKIDITLRYEVATGGETLIARASESGITLRNLQLAERGQTAPSIAIETIALSGISATNGNGQSLRIERIAIDNGSIAVLRDVDGLRLAELLAPAASTNAAPPPAAATSVPLPDVSIGELLARNITINIEDATLETPLRTQAVIDTLGVRHFALAKPGTPLALELTARISDGGTLRADGELALAPLRGKLTAELTGVPLKLARAHAGQYLNTRIDGGLLTAKAAVAIDPDAGLAATADAGITGFAMTDASGGPLQSWKTLALRGITFASKPAAKITIDEIAIDGSSTQVTIAPGAGLNLAALAKQTEPPPATPSAPPAPGTTPANTSPLLIAIAKVSLTDGRVAFSDTSIAPAVKMSLDKINGSISGLSSENLARADVDLHAKINGAAPVALVGQVNPLSNDAYSDLRFTIDAAALAPLSPYVGKYAGRALAAGTLNVDIATKVSQRFLDSKNVITLDQFELGERVDSPDATSLPVGLAVAILRDRNGKIVLDVPVKGSLDDPDFKYGRAVWRAIGNLLVKAATAPFSLLTGMLGIGGGQSGAADAAATDLAHIEFDAGAGALNEASRKKLALLAKALLERPSLQLAIAAGFDETGDRAVLRDIRLRDLLRQEYLGESGGQPAAQSAEKPELAPEIEARLIALLYQRALSAGAPAEPGPAVTVPLPSQDEMRARLLETMPPASDDELRLLASARAQSVKDYLVSEGVAPDRIAPADTPASGAQASLDLR